VHLNLSNNEISPDLCESLITGLKGTSLLSLDLSANKIQDAGLAHFFPMIGQFQAFYSLRELNLANNQLTNYSVSFLFDHLSKNGRIQKLILDQNSLYG